MTYQGTAYTDQVRAGLWEAWQREAYGESWGTLRERLRYSSHASWDPYFEAFNEENRDLLEIPPDVSWDEYRENALDTFLRWFDDHVDWQLFESQAVGGYTSAEAQDQSAYTQDQGQGQAQWGHGTEQDMSAQASGEYFDAHASGTWTGYAETSVPEAQTESAAHTATPSDNPPAADASASGPADIELAREALQVMVSSDDDPSVLTEAHVAALKALPFQVEAEFD
ncbi:hypothetical protein ACWC4D_23585 [Streptomyces sp. NPDC001288]|uniref:hypothetical protein n=1 Tax=unclassified Streptomyces TaxID=2593676 RepID=UPI003319A373